MKRVTVALIVSALLLMAGCDAEPEPDTRTGTKGRTETFWVTTVDGRRIPCVSWSGFRESGLSCDWGAK